MLLECLAITLIFALTCAALLIFMKFRGRAPAASMPEWSQSRRDQP
jgi:hypothetical protein